MKRDFPSLIAVTLLATLCQSGLVHGQGKDDFRSRSESLFDGESLDGESLDGWEGNLKWFRVEGDSIVAGSLTEQIPHNEFLCTTRKFGDFELRYQAKLVGEGKNAGVQFRSERVPESTEVSGYQADIGTAWDRPVWGALYDESRRKKMLAEPDPNLARRIVKEGEWNRFRVVCEGARIRIFLNGDLTVDYTEADPDVARDGVIGLQIHSGPPCEAWYRNIRIRTLDAN